MNATKATMNVSKFRTFGQIAAWVALLLPIQAYALSLGGFQVESALDEPLRAEIQLESVDAETLESLEVKLGSADDFRRADVPRSEYLQQLEFSVTEQSGDSAVVSVTSEQPIREPFLHFLISVEWQGGKLVREYTGLLDPPLYAGDSPSRVESPVVESAQPVQGDAPAAAQTTEPAAAESPSAVAPSTAGVAGRSAEYGPTREGDTLWDIASRLDTGNIQASVFQIMIALQRENPEAFIDNNVNRLKTGQVLRLSDISVVAEMSPEQAGAAYTAQLEAWQASQGQVASASGTGDAAGESASATAAAEPGGDGDGAVEGAGDQADADTAAASEEAAAAEGQDDVLRIVQANMDESEQSAAASAGSSPSGELAELQSQVASLQESLESRNLENEELRERVRLLESQLENAQRLIEIESQELAAAQQQATQAQQEAARAQAEAAAAQEQAMETESAAETGSDTQAAAPAVQPAEEAGQEAMEEELSPALDEPAQGGADTTAQAPDSGAPEVESSQQSQASAVDATAAETGQSGESTQPVRTVSNRPVQASWWSRIPDLVFSSWTWMAGAALGVLVLVLGLLMFLRRRQSIAEFEESILSGSALDSYSDTTDSAASSASDTSFLSDFGTAGMGTMQADEVDPLAEAEVYLAYGRDEQAEEVLKEAARRDPERSEVKLKLLEIYKQRNDVKSFETIAEELYPAGDSGDHDVWHQVTAMGRELSPNNPLFQEATAAGDGGAEAPAGAPAAAPSAASAGGEETSQMMDFNLDDLGPQQAAGPAAEQVAPANEQAGDELGFDLETDMAPEPEAPTAAAAGSDDSTLDFSDDFMEQPRGNVDPATQPFPTPDEQTDLDRELDRLASEREASPAAPASGAGSKAADGAETPGPELEANWERAGSDGGTLDFPTTDTSDIDFDLNLDESSLEQLSGSAVADEELEARPAAEAPASDSDELEDRLLEFESENIPPEETWAGPSSDAAPAPDDESVAYSPVDDVQSAAAPQYNEAETKLDLARAYLDMGDKIGARSIIDEVMREGDPAQRDQAAELASQL